MQTQTDNSGFPQRIHRLSLKSIPSARSTDVNFELKRGKITRSSEKAAWKTTLFLAHSLHFRTDASRREKFSLRKNKEGEIEEIRVDKLSDKEMRARWNKVSMVFRPRGALLRHDRAPAVLNHSRTRRNCPKEKKQNRGQGSKGKMPRSDGICR
ncbi:MAG: hypothetical protein ACLRSW_03560 [Christensenellaceae bacterium]